MNDKLTIPKNIKVGFCERDDTYSGRLAFVVPIDKGKVRKEVAWEGWRDKKIAPENYDNDPTTGFVLNRDVGGTQRCYSWNARREKVRVFDPRNFEIEITVENLLFILQECSSIKGKGLEGEFVYAWSGRQLVLLPTTSKEYKSSTEFTDLQKEKVSAKEVIPGYIYLTKDKEQVMYLGRFSWWRQKSERIDSDRYSYNHRYITKSKEDKTHVFVYLNKENRSRHYIYWRTNSFAKLAKKISQSPSPDFADEYDRLDKTGYTSKPVKIVFSDKEITKTKLKSNKNYGIENVAVCRDGKTYIGRVAYWKQYGQDDGENYTIDCRKSIRFTNEGYSIEDENEYSGVYIEKQTAEQVIDTVREYCIECENGVRLKLNDCPY